MKIGDKVYLSKTYEHFYHNQGSIDGNQIEGEIIEVSKYKKEDWIVEWTQNRGIYHYEELNLELIQTPNNYEIY